MSNASHYFFYLVIRVNERKRERKGERKRVARCILRRIFCLRTPRIAKRFAMQNRPDKRDIFHVPCLVIRGEFYGRMCRCANINSNIKIKYARTHRTHTHKTLGQLYTKNRHINQSIIRCITSSRLLVHARIHARTRARMREYIGG